MGISLITARFNLVDGDLVVDRNGSQSRIDVTLRTDSVVCPDPAWNTRIRSKDWFYTQHYPEISYRSDDVEFDGNGRATVHGVLTLRAVSRPVTLVVSRIDCANEPAASPSCSFVADAQIRRSEFGLPHGFWLGGDEVDISINGVGLR